MQLNTLKPAIGAKKTAKRLGRGIGSGFGKTSGRGHKGQHARAGGYHKVGFEGGQMPLQRRLPKFGFNSKKAKDIAEIQLLELLKIATDTIDIQILREAGLIRHTIKRVKIIGKQQVDKALHIIGLVPTQGAKTAIEAAGGTVK